MFRTNRCSKCFLGSELNRSFDRSLINGQKPDHRLKLEVAPEIRTTEQGEIIRKSQRAIGIKPGQVISITQAVHWLVTRETPVPLERFQGRRSDLSNRENIVRVVMIFSVLPLDDQSEMIEFHTLVFIVPAIQKFPVRKIRVISQGRWVHEIYGVPVVSDSYRVMAVFPVSRIIDRRLGPGLDQDDDRYPVVDKVPDVIKDHFRPYIYKVTFGTGKIGHCFVRGSIHGVSFQLLDQRVLGIVVMSIVEVQYRLQDRNTACVVTALTSEWNTNEVSHCACGT